ncbi:MAG: TIGR00268 family protein, partial [Selenomonadaceae bacterium]|nr:TIGR00268 family protein [Selenomonadaceae bacterium]
QFLIERGFRQLRVRIHVRLARIEIEPTEFDRLLKLRAELSTTFKAIGFQYVALDLQGYRTGSMNETINREDSTT